MFFLLLFLVYFCYFIFLLWYCFDSCPPPLLVYHCGYAEDCYNFFQRLNSIELMKIISGQVIKRDRPVNFTASIRQKVTIVLIYGQCTLPKIYHKIRIKKNTATTRQILFTFPAYLRPSYLTSNCRVNLR